LIYTDTDSIGSESTGCTEIESDKVLENVLKEVRWVTHDKMCRDLDITRATCNPMTDRLDPFILSQKYREQHPGAMLGEDHQGAL